MPIPLKHIVIILALLQSHLVLAQVIPDSRLVDWTKVGAEDISTETWLKISIDTVNVPGISQATADQQMQRALELTKGRAAVILLPGGTYHFDQPLILRDSLILKGEGSSSSKLIFDLGGKNHAIEARGKMGRDSLYITQSISKGDSYIHVPKSDLFRAGDNLIVTQHDSAWISSWWAKGTVGQIVEIDRVEDEKIFLKQALRRSYDKKDLPFIRKIFPVQHIGIECLGIERKDATATQTSHVYFSYVKNGWVKNVESINCNFAHIEIDHSFQVEVSGSYLHHAHDYGNGGKAYGVMLHFTSGDCLIENNIFERLRHSMIVQAGANGNVFGYNYSRNPFWTGVFLPSDAAGDMVLHGNYPYANLFEGNIAQTIVVDGSHGINGAFNTFFRNRLELYGIFALGDPPTQYLNLVGNELTNRDDSKGFYVLGGDNHWEYANQVKGNFQPVAMDSLPIVSLYREENISFRSDFSLPAIGVPIQENTQSIPARDRFFQGDFDICEAERAGPTTHRFRERDIADRLLVAPNPFQETFRVRLMQDFIHIRQLALIDINGQKVSWLPDVAPPKNLAKGLYILEVETSDNQVLYKKIVKQ